ncbi:hypothetical protein BDY19DRAFT_955363 [Irpex rosettiformis]|uniref:Uncharacterized protein n=1 Tax=Irpex rosettiformis TaxID=378272 RepID=A0ACB8TZW8_9APHY|nr:hypothetical protein BDY19DRAFT_955363 [Irpex rosettiformis]
MSCARSTAGVHAQIAGLYLAIVMILVNHQRSTQVLVSTDFVNKNVNNCPDKAAPLSYIIFAGGPVGEKWT